MTGVAEPAAAERETVPDFADLGVLAFTTTRQAGSFGTASDEPVRDVMARWDRLRAALAPHGPRLATARQVHGNRVIVHGPAWAGWLRGDDADGHASIERGTGMAVSVADCVPVFVVHPSGACALLHSGWRGTEAAIVRRGIDVLRAAGLDPAEMRVHLGPAICGRCYEVSPDVYGRLTGRTIQLPTPVDLRDLIAGQARASGVRRITTSPLCTRCDNDRFFSHRAGDAGRELGVMIASM
jgi:purine-nucleoside/S-methyl-5'-thioadenosine phosphorylase / adenosine deaminase